MTSRPSSPRDGIILQVLLPAIVMSLGWGLRGYIGGGPFGAMIPGALVSLLLCHFLRYSLPAAAVVTVFGTIGIGFGGNMTYGQTLGLIRESETFLHGLAGTTIKGAVWGFLGGAVLGLGFAARHISRRHLAEALAAMLLGVIVGIYYINAPQLIHFSDPVNKPRDESWAGFWLGATTLLAYMKLMQPRFAWLPWKFAAYGAAGGAIGFGVGSLFMPLQVMASENWKWLPYWKFMEFFFGLLFGAALGLCARHHRDRLPLLGTTGGDEASKIDEPLPSATMWEVIPSALLVLIVFDAWGDYVSQLLPDLDTLARSDFNWTMADVLFDFTGLGCILLIFACRWQTVAWQSAISVTIVAAAIDWQRDLAPRGQIEWSESVRLVFVLCMAAFTIAVVQRWQHRQIPRLLSLYLFALCILMLFGWMMGVAHANLWTSDPETAAAAGGRGAWLWQQYRSEVIVHGIFGTLFLVSAGAAFVELRRLKRQTQERDSNE